jgi:hypothetical protein
MTYETRLNQQKKMGNNFKSKFQADQDSVFD